MANYLWAHCSDLMFVIADLLHPVSRPTVERFHNRAVRYSCICQCYKSGLCDALSRLPTRTIMLPWVILLIKCELAPAVHSATLDPVLALMECRLEPTPEENQRHLSRTSE